MLCAAIDIGSNTTRLLVAEVAAGRLRKVSEERAYTRINRALDGDGAIRPEKVAEVADVVAGQARRARELGAEEIRSVATAAIRKAPNGAAVARAVGEAAGVAVDVLSEEEEGRLSFIGATRALGHPVEGAVAVVDVGGGSTEVVVGSLSDGPLSIRSWPLGSGRLAGELIESDPPTGAEIGRVRERVEEVFAGVEIDRPEQAVAVGGSATSLRRLAGPVLERETLDRSISVLTAAPAAQVARRFALDPERVRILPAGVVVLAKVSELLGRPLRIGRGGLREGIVLDLFDGRAGPPEPEVAA